MCSNKELIRGRQGSGVSLSPLCCCGTHKGILLLLFFKRIWCRLPALFCCTIPHQRISTVLHRWTVSLEEMLSFTPGSWGTLEENSKMGHLTWFEQENTEEAQAALAGEQVKLEIQPGYVCHGATSTAKRVIRKDLFPSECLDNVLISQQPPQDAADETQVSLVRVSLQR